MIAWRPVGQPCRTQNTEALPWDLGRQAGLSQTVMMQSAVSQLCTVMAVSQLCTNSGCESVVPYSSGSVSTVASQSLAHACFHAKAQITGSFGSRELGLM